MSGTLFEALRLVVVVAAVRASFKHSEGSSAAPHGLIDARTAPLTTPSSRRRVSILRERRTPSERAPRGRIIRDSVSRAVGRSVGVNSRGARAAAPSDDPSRVGGEVACGGGERARSILDRSEETVVVGRGKGIAERANDGPIDVYRRAPRMSLETSRGKTTVTLAKRDANPAGRQPGLPPLPPSRTLIARVSLVLLDIQRCTARVSTERARSGAAPRRSARARETKTERRDRK